MYGALLWCGMLIWMIFRLISSCLPTCCGESPSRDLPDTCLSARTWLMSVGINHKERGEIVDGKEQDP